MARFIQEVENPTTKMRYQFDLDIKFVEVNIEMDVLLLCLWKRGMKRLATRNKVHIGGDVRKAEVNETLTMIGTLKQNTATGEYVDKASSLTIKVITETKTRSIGQIKINLSDFVDKEPKTKVAKLSKCADKSA